jgi:hypothetical protein
MFMGEGEPASIVLSDMAHIHEDRVRIYKEILQNIKHLETDVKAIFERMAEESIRFGQQLTSSLGKRNGNEGIVYRAWPGVSVSANTRDKKTILAGCINDELALMNVYSFSLSFTTLDRNIREPLLFQKQEVEGLCDHIKQFHDAQ